MLEGRGSGLRTGYGRYYQGGQRTARRHRQWEGGGCSSDWQEHDGCAMYSTDLTAGSQCAGSEDADYADQ